MPIASFPDPKNADPDGLVAVGGDLHPKSVVLAYQNGIFPWPIEGLPLTWFSPPDRAILEFEDLHISKSLERFQKRDPFSYTENQVFKDVIQNCATVPRPKTPNSEEEGGTWITEEMIDAYTLLHDLGYAHSVEVWEQKELVGGIYGVEVDGVFSAESMFHKKSNASKMALVHLIKKAQEKGFDWIDIQVSSPHMTKMGAKVISRDHFLNRLRKAKQLGRVLFGFPKAL